MAWVNITGLVLDLIGALVLTRVLILTRNQAVELGVTRVAGDTLEQNLKLPAVRDRLRQSRYAVAGAAFLATGFALQVVASWP